MFKKKLAFLATLAAAPLPRGAAGASNPGPAGVIQLQELLQRLINISVAIAFIALTVVLLYAGIRYLTSGGEVKSMAAASQAITWGLLGILFLSLAWLILLLIQAFTGIQLTNLCIGLGDYTNSAVGNFIGNGCI